MQIIDVSVQRQTHLYEAADPTDGFRILVDRVWPPGLAKEAARIDLWLRDVAPSTPLRKWFGHDPARWDEFRKRYFAELDQNIGLVEEILNNAAKKSVTLLFGAKVEEHNNAVALKEYLLNRSPKRKRRVGSSDHQRSTISP